MAGIIFDYMPGRLDARFVQDKRFDFIRLRMRMRNAEVVTTPCDDKFRRLTPVSHRQAKVEFSVRISSVFCPFDDYIRFLEAITTGVRECSFDWDAEGQEGTMRWERRYLHENGFLNVTWAGYYREHKQEFSHRMMLDTHQTVGMLYHAFRNFVESPDYDPLRYENIEAGDGFCLVLKDAGLEELTAALVAMGADTARHLLLSMGDVMRERAYVRPALRNTRYTLAHYLNAASSREISDRESDEWICAEWNSMDQHRRAAYLREQLYSSGMTLGFGGNLRSMRSKLVEEWLTRPELRASWRARLKAKQSPPS